MKQRKIPATAIERVANYIENRTGMGGLDPDEINTVCRDDGFHTLSLKDLRELVQAAKELAALKSQVIVHWSGDWAALSSEDGSMIDQGHWEDLHERILSNLGIGMEYPTDPFPFNRRVPEGTNLSKYL